jgi:AcrR family transcriptional regulator
MEAARLVVAEKGLDAGAAEIAARAEVGVGTLYRRFGTKEALVIDIVNERARPRILFIIHEAMKRL